MRTVVTHFIGDTHFFHKNILGFAGQFRPFQTLEEHNAELVRRWNSVVHPEDKVFHLGDFSFGGVDNISIAGQLNGRKFLVMGNHDAHPAAEYLKYFEKLYGAVEYKGFILTHIPISESQFLRYRGNIHGHLHHYKEANPKYINVSCEHINCTPIPFHEVERRYEAAAAKHAKYFDNDFRA